MIESRAQSATGRADVNGSTELNVGRGGDVLDKGFARLSYQRLVDRPPWVNVAIHATLISLAFLTAFALRFDFQLPYAQLDLFLVGLPVLLVVRLLVFRQSGLFRVYWQHVGARDLVNLIGSVTVSSVLFVVVLFFTGLLRGMPRSVLIMDWFLVIFFCGGIRFVTRYLWEARPRQPAGTGRRTLLVGAGAGAELLLRQCQHEPDNDLSVVGMVDDDPSATDRLLHGVPVLGGTQDLARLVQSYHIELLVITVQHATKDQMRDLVDRCAATGVEYKILPSLTELLSAPKTGGRLRDVRIEDLLGRQPVILDLVPVARDVAGRTILITGAAGSIGSELARQLAGFRPSRLILFERAESPLYFVNLEIARAYPELQIIPVIGDVTDGDRVHQVFARVQPDYVFHAAAYKHVPMLEVNSREAVRNNVFGTQEIVTAALENGVKKVVLISTDKAVNPSSVMGATKHIAERVMLSARLRTEAATEFRVVRFGNVLGSDGSVIPLFQRQLAAGQPLTVTHPDVRRYFMTIPEAVQLVLQASLLPEAAGRIAMLEMGEPVRILYLAEQIIRLSGLVPYKDVPILFTGLRRGEKLDEELTSEIEATIPTVVEKIRLVQSEAIDAHALEYGLDRLATAVTRGRDHEVRDALRALVPKYRESSPRPPFADVDVEVAGLDLGIVDGGLRTKTARVASSASNEYPTNAAGPASGRSQRPEAAQQVL